MKAILEFLLEPHVLATWVSLLTVWGATEPLKRLVRRTTKTSDDWTPRGVGFVLGLGMGLVTWPADTNVPPAAFGVMIGVAAPLMHMALLAVIKWKWPELAKRLTGGG